MKCWGDNANGELGDLTATRRSAPVEVIGLTEGVTMVSAGNSFTCAVVNRAAQCWGNNDNGQLGGNRPSTMRTPVEGLGEGIIAVAAGGGPVSSESHACAIQYGFTKCWGANNVGQLGNATTSRVSQTPRQSEGLALAAPTQLRAETVTAHSIAVSWNRPIVAEDLSIETYTISWEYDPVLTMGVVVSTVSISASLTDHIISGLRSDTSYQIKVVAVNRGGIGRYSDILTVRTGISTPPSIPRNLRARGETTGTIAIDWMTPANDGGRPITEYLVFWSSVSDRRKTSSVRITGEPLATSYVITEIDGESLILETFYRIEVSAANIAGSSPRAIREQQTGSLAIILRIQVLLEGALQ